MYSNPAVGHVSVLDEVLARDPAHGVTSGPGGVRTRKTYRFLTMYSVPAVERVLVATKGGEEVALPIELAPGDDVKSGRYGSNVCTPNRQSPYVSNPDEVFARGVDSATALTRRWDLNPQAALAAQVALLRLPCTPTVSRDVFQKLTDEVFEPETFGALPLSYGATRTQVAPVGFEPTSPGL